MKQAFDQFCLHHQRAILLLALASILTSTWYIFYGSVGEKGRKLLTLLLIIITIITVYGAWYVNDYFGSMRVGPQIDLVSKKTVMVAPEDHDRAKEVISNFLERRTDDEEVEMRYTQVKN